MQHVQHLPVQPHVKMEAHALPLTHAHAYQVGQEPTVPRPFARRLVKMGELVQLPTLAPAILVTPIQHVLRLFVHLLD